jgi:hypothetical protein
VFEQIVHGPVGAQIERAWLGGEREIRQLIVGERAETVEVDGEVDRNGRQPHVPLEVAERREIGIERLAERASGKRRERLAVFREARDRRRVCTHERLGSVGETTLAHQPRQRWEPRQQRADESRAIVSLVDRQARDRIQAADEGWQRRRGCTRHDSLAGRRLRVSERHCASSAGRRRR